MLQPLRIKIHAQRHHARTQQNGYGGDDFRVNRGRAKLHGKSQGNIFRLPEKTATKKEQNFTAKMQFQAA